MEAVVIDPGSHTLKAGYAAYNTPADLGPTVVVPPCVIDTAATSCAEIDSQQPCIEQGSVTRYDHFEALLHDVLYNELGWKIGDEGNILYAEPLFISKGEREDICQLMFEVFNVSGLFFCEQALLSLYACGRQTGCVIDAGHGKIDIATVSDGQIHYPGVKRLGVSGRDLDGILRTLLEDRGFSNLRSTDIQRIKEHLAAVAPNARAYADLKAAAAGGKQELRSHTLPDGQEITVAHEGHALGEALFDLDGALGASEPGLAEAIHAGIVNSYEPSLRKIVYEHLILCGGLSGLPGIGERLMQELRLLAPPSTIPTLYPFPDYMPDHTKNCSVWMGGAILSKVVFPQSHHMTRGDYDERGPSGAHIRCG